MSRFARTAAAAIGFALGIAGCSDRAAETAPQMASQLADPTGAGAVAAGEAVYLEHCASCHGARLEGQANWQEALPDGGYPAPPHDGTGHTWRHTDLQLFEATKFANGFSAAPGTVSHMPAFEDLLTDDEIWAALAFIKSHWPAELQARQRLMTRMHSSRQGADRAGHTGHATAPAM